MAIANFLWARLVLAVLVSVSALSGCASKMSDLTPSTGSAIIISDTYYSIDKRGPLDVLWRTGLVKGVYREVARDEAGTYFLGEANSVINWMDKCGFQYPHSGSPPTYLEKMKCGTAIVPYEISGIWIPFDLKKNQPGIFVVTDPKLIEPVNTHVEVTTIGKVQPNGTAIRQNGPLSAAGTAAVYLAAIPARAWLEGRAVIMADFKDEKMKSLLIVRKNID